MGIRKLTTYVMEHNEVATSWDRSFQLKDTRVVIDGGGLLYKVLDACGPNGGPGDERCGGQYSDFYACTRAFCLELERHDVRPLVVLDGVSASVKEETAQQRFMDHLQFLAELSESKPITHPGTVLPLWAKSVFVEALVDSRVAVVRTDREADDTIAALGMHCGCPIMANDSDFFVCDLPGGVVHFKKLDILHPCTPSRPVLFRRSLFATALSRNQELRGYRVEEIEGLLALAGSLSGNDYVPLAKVKGLYPRISCSSPLVDSLQWMLRTLQVRTVEEGMAKLSELAPATIAGIRHSVQMYNPSPALTRRLAESCLSLENLQTSFLLDPSAVNDSLCDDAAGSSDGERFPGWLMEDYHLGLLLPNAQLASIQTGIRVQLSVEAYTHYGSSCNVDRPLRALRGALLSKELDKVQEQVRASRALAIRQVDLPLWRSVPEYEGRVPFVGEVSDVTNGDRQKLLLLALRSHTASISRLPLSFQLIAASLRFLWCRMKDDNCRDQPQISTRHLKVLLVGIVSNCQAAIEGGLPCFDHDDTIRSQKEVLYHWSMDTHGTSSEDDLSLAYRDSIMSPDKCHTGDFDNTIVHVFNAWQRIVIALHSINLLLGTPFPLFRLRCLYNGVRSYDLFTDSAVEDVFQATPHQDLIQILWFAVSDGLPRITEAPATGSPTRAKRKARKAAKSDRVSSRTSQAHGLANRFAGMEIE